MNSRCPSCGTNSLTTGGCYVCGHGVPGNIRSTKTKEQIETLDLLKENAGLKAKLAKAVEALEFYNNAGEFRPYGVASSNFILETYHEKAEQTLAEIKGDGDDV